MPDTLFLLEDNPGRLAEMIAVARAVLPTWMVHVEDDCQLAIDWLAENQATVGLISLDHDLDSVVRPDEPPSVDHGCGRPVADFISTQPPTCPVIIHTSNTIAGDGMFFQLYRANWPVHRVYPYDKHKWVTLAWKDKLNELITCGWLTR